MDGKIKIIAKKRGYVIVEKPAGVLSQKDALGENGLVEMLSEQLHSSVYPVHRLDRPVGGVMVFALDKENAARLSAENAFQKTYLAVVSGECPPEGEMTDYLYKDGANGKSFAVKSERKGARLARLAFKRISFLQNEYGTFSLVEVRLFTGRTHQIRVQFSSRGMPLVGDGKYGSRIKAKSIALWSHKIEFIEPVNGKTEIYISLPSENEWFDTMLGQIQK